MLRYSNTSQNTERAKTTNTPTQMSVHEQTVRGLYCSAGMEADWERQLSRGEKCLRGVMEAK